MARDLTFRCLAGVSLTVDEGEVVALVGPSGSGKSTLLSVLAGWTVADSGEVVRPRIGFVFQSQDLLPSLTALENIAVPLWLGGVAEVEALAQAEVWLREVGLESHRDHLPEELSGGQRQRVGIARALVTDPEVLMADEPTGQLDSQTAADIADLIVRLGSRPGHAALVATHDLALARKAHRPCRLHQGILTSGVTL